MTSAAADTDEYRASKDAPVVLTLSTSSATTCTVRPSASVASSVTSGTLTPGLLGTLAGIVFTFEPRAFFASLTKRLYAAMPASDDDVAPSVYLPKMATILSASSSQTLWYS